MSHPFVQILDDEPVEGHVFSTLKMEVGKEWVPLEIRCCLCNKVPLELLNAGRSVSPCEGISP